MFFWSALTQGGARASLTLGYYRSSLRDLSLARCARAERHAQGVKCQACRLCALGQHKGSSVFLRNGKSWWKIWRASRRASCHLATSSQVGPENCLDSQIDWSSLDLASRSCAAEKWLSRRMTARRVRLARQSLSLWPRAATGRMVAGRLAFTQARKESMIWSSVKWP